MKDSWECESCKSAMHKFYGEQLDELGRMIHKRDEIIKKLEKRIGDQNCKDCIWYKYGKCDLIDKKLENEKACRHYERDCDRE